MRITSKQLEQLIKEEVSRQIDEASFMQKVGSYITGKPTDDDMLEKAANEIIYEIDRHPPILNSIYNDVFMTHRVNPKAMKMALEDKVMKMPLTLGIARKHGIEIKDLRKTVRLILDDLLELLRSVHEARMGHSLSIG
jgi:hypothetical protein